MTTVSAPTSIDHAWSIGRMELRLLRREPVALFFVIGLPIILLLLIGGGGEEEADLLPGLLGLVVATTTVVVLPEHLASMRERGIVRRFLVAPISPWTFAAGQVLFHLVLVVGGAAALCTIGIGRLGLAAPTAPAIVLAVGLLGTVALFAFGTLIASLVRTARTASAVANGIYFPMIFISGAAWPQEELPEAVRRVAEALPLTHVIALLADAWVGHPLELWRVAVLAALTVGAALIAAIVLVRE